MLYKQAKDSHAKAQLFHTLRHRSAILQEMAVISCALSEDSDS